MGFRFRKSINIAPGVRLNIGKKSAGISVGGKGARYSVNTSGRRTTTVGIPGTGLSYSKTSKSAKGFSMASRAGELSPEEYDAALEAGKKKAKGPLLVMTIFLGWAGGHYFMMHRPGMGILYLCTFGLLGIGWIVDIVRIARI